MLRRPNSLRLKSLGTLFVVLSAFALAFSQKNFSGNVATSGTQPDKTTSSKNSNLNQTSDGAPEADDPIARLRLSAVPHARPGSFQEMSRVLSHSDWNALSPEDRQLARHMLLDRRSGHPVFEPCFAPGTPARVIRAFSHLGSAVHFSTRLQTDANSRWTNTATNANIGAGDPFTLTWNLANDGSRENDNNGAASNLRAWAVTTYGSEEAFRVVVRSIFARYEQLTGIHYVEVNYDDGAPIFSSPGVLNVRADIRIGGKRIDGNYNVLAYNAFPNSGDMMIDTEDSFFKDAGTGVGLFNTLAHEHGHGLGLGHTCPGNGTKLMEPGLSTNFKGPQLDDILAVQFNYGDGNEHAPRNNTTLNAVNLGTLSIIGEKDVDEQSINATSVDVDYFYFTPDARNRAITIQVVPRGAVYLQGPQNADGSCSAGTDFDPTKQRNLTVSLLNGSGTELAKSTQTGLGETKTIDAYKAGGATFPLIVKISATDETTAVQGYTLKIKEASYIDPTPTPSATPSATATPAPTATPLPTATPIPLPLGSIAFSEVAYSVKENAGKAVISVQRVARNGQGRSGTVSVSYQASDITAKAGLDYKAVTGTLFWANGDSSVKTFAVPILDDTIRELNETVSLRLFDLQGTGTIAPTRKTATLTITDNETGSFDKTPPRVTVTDPEQSATVSDVDVIQGTATDEGGSGVASVVLYIQRPSDGRYWNGTSWGTIRTALTTKLVGKTWARTSGNPPKTSINDDFLVINAVATDGSGNIGQVAVRAFVDGSPPAVYIQSPYSGARIKALGRVFGTVSDGEGDSTLVIYLRRASDRKYWTGVGNNWVATPTPLPVNLALSGEWNRSIWPTLTAGNYALIATGIDEAGNSASAVAEFTITASSTSSGAS